jgi:hypothetical protein
VRLEDLPDFLRGFGEEHLRQNIDASQHEVQGVYDRVFEAGQGKSIDEVKELLAAEWRSTFGTELPEADAFKVAEVLARGQRIRLTLTSASD